MSKPCRCCSWQQPKPGVGAAQEGRRGRDFHTQLRLNQTWPGFCTGSRGGGEETVPGILKIPKFRVRILRGSGEISTFPEIPGPKFGVPGPDSERNLLFWELCSKIEDFSHDFPGFLQILDLARAVLENTRELVRVLHRRRGGGEIFTQKHG